MYEAFHSKVVLDVVGNLLPKGSGSGYRNTNSVTLGIGGGAFRPTHMGSHLVIADEGDNGIGTPERNDCFVVGLIKLSLCIPMSYPQLS